MQRARRLGRARRPGRPRDRPARRARCCPGTSGRSAPGAARRPAPAAWPRSGSQPGTAARQSPAQCRSAGLAAPLGCSRGTRPGRADGLPMPQSPQSSSTLWPPASADPRVLPGWKSPCTRVSGRPHSATAANRCGSPSTSGAQPRDDVVGQRLRDHGSAAARPRATNRSGPASRAHRRPRGRPPGRPTTTAGRRAWPRPGAAPAAGAPVVLARLRRRAGSAAPRPRSAVAPPPGRADSSIAPSWAKNGGTTLSQAVPAAVGSCQMLDRFQVRHLHGGAGACAARRGQRGARPRRGRRPGHRAWRTAAAAAARRAGPARRAATGTGPARRRAATSAR